MVAVIEDCFGWDNLLRPLGFGVSVHQMSVIEEAGSAAGNNTTGLPDLEIEELKYKSYCTMRYKIH